MKNNNKNNVKEHPASKGDSQSNHTDGRGLDVSSCSAFSLLAQFPIGVQEQMKEIVRKHGKDAKISYRTIRMPHPQHPDQTVVLYDDVQLACN